MLDLCCHALPFSRPLPLEALALLVKLEAKRKLHHIYIVCWQMRPETSVLQVARLWWTTIPWTNFLSYITFILWAKETWKESFKATESRHDHDLAVCLLFNFALKGDRNKCCYRILQMNIHIWFCIPKNEDEFTWNISWFLLFCPSTPPLSPLNGIPWFDTCGEQQCTI